MYIMYIVYKYEHVYVKMSGGRARQRVLATILLLSVQAGLKLVTVIY